MMKRKVVLVVRVCGWLVIALATLEICARTEDKVRYGAPFTKNYSLDSLYGYDRLGKYGMPNASYMKWHLNNAGYRGPALRPGTYRVACLGSSETFGLYESPEHEWPRRLEARLAQSSGNRIEVVNAAYAGMSIVTNIKRLPRMLGALHPQMAVIYPSYTWYIENATALPWPQPLVDPGPLRQQGGFHLRMAGKVEALFKTYTPSWLQDAVRAWQTRRAVRGIAVQDALPQENVDAFRTDLQRLVTQLQAANVKVVLVTHATRFGARPLPEDRALLREWRKFYPSLTENGLLDMEQRMSAVVRDVAAKDGVPVVDAAARIAPGKENFAEFVHFTDAGADALAGLIAGEVERGYRAGGDKQ